MDTQTMLTPSVNGEQIPEHTPVDKHVWLKKLARLVKKYWYVVVVIVVILAGLATWQIIAAREDAAWKRATDYFTRAEYEKAAGELKGMAMPSTAEHLRVYGQTMLATRDLDKSLEAYKKLYSLNKDPSVQLIIGNIYNEQKKYDDAIKVYRELIAANANNVQAYVNIATVYKLQNNTSAAVEVAKDGVEKNPGSVVLRELLVSMLMNNKQSQEYKDAVAALKKLNPEDQLLQALHE